MSRVVIFQDDGLMVDWRELDDDVHVLFVDYPEIKARAERGDVEYIKNIRNTALDWELDDVVIDIDDTTETAGGWKITDPPPPRCERDYMAGQICMLPRGHEGSHQ